ncbi:MAG: MSMEG_0567/Sll0786 family nitrogen starvation N-acetyltransferase [Streptosporangiaceae bacterium]
MDQRVSMPRAPSPRPASGPAARCRLATTRRDRLAHFAVRHAVFVTEQGFFQGTDRDERDERPGTRHVLASSGGVPAGAVRLYPLDDPGIWRGDRLAVLPAFRCQGVGAPLVRFAVMTAARLGGHRMVAHIQPQNAAFFGNLGWHQVGDQVTYIGHPHLLMAIALAPGAGRGRNG